MWSPAPNTTRFDPTGVGATLVVAHSERDAVRSGAVGATLVVARSGCDAVRSGTGQARPLRPTWRISSACHGQMLTCNDPTNPQNTRMPRETFTSSRRPQRKPLRLANFDYAEPQSYFVTIVARERRCVFGRVEHEHVLPSPAGKMVAREWRALGDRFGIEIRPFVVMPNHLHGLVSTCATVDPPALGRIVGAFKSITAREYRIGVGAWRWPAMPNGLWQRGYFDHVVRDETDEARISDYINANPVNWVTDPNNPDSPDRTSDDHRLWPKSARKRRRRPARPTASPAGSSGRDGASPSPTTPGRRPSSGRPSRSPVPNATRSMRDGTSPSPTTPGRCLVGATLAVARAERDAVDAGRDTPPATPGRCPRRGDPRGRPCRTRRGRCGTGQARPLRRLADAPRRGDPCGRPCRKRRSRNATPRRRWRWCRRCGSCSRRWRSTRRCP